MNNSPFIDIGAYQNKKTAKHCFGDTIYSKKKPEETPDQRASDGPGSGVKANILSSMTTIGWQ